jgi:hypothetical protein
MEQKLPQDFKEFLRLLNDREIRYLLIGGFAVGFHGYARFTDDLDVWISRDPTNAHRMVEALREFGFDVPELNEALFCAEDSMVRMGYPPVRIEVKTSISGVDFGEAEAESVIMEREGIRIPTISLHHLKENKRASGRHKDLDDLEHLPETDP